MSNDVIFAQIAHIFGYTIEEIYKLPMSQFNTLYEQSFNMINLSAGNGAYKPLTTRDEQDNLRAEYEAIKGMIKK